MAAPFDTTDPEALRRAIIAKMGIDPTKLTAFGGNAKFDADITAMYRSALDKMAGYDTQQSRLGQDYEQQLANLQEQQTNANRILDNNLADRGLMYSGAALTQKATAGEDYAKKLQALTLAKTRGIEDLGAARNSTTYDVLNNRGNYEGQYTQNLQDFLTQQAQAAATAAAAKPLPVPAAPKIAVKPKGTPTIAAVQRKMAPVKLTWGGGGTPAPAPAAKKLPTSTSAFRVF